MTTNNKLLSAFALSAAAMFLGGCKDKPPTTDPGSVTQPDPATNTGPVASAESPDDQVKCFGVNSCRGESVCAVNKPELGIEHACAGENECAQKGWIKLTRADCETQKGEVLGTL
jgi:hypothetical protein